MAPPVTQPDRTTIPTTSTTTTPSIDVLWTVDKFGRNPLEPLGTSPAAGSGCSPGTDQLPDGIWFGWVTDFGTSRIEFDLACLWPGRLEAAVSNDAARVRTLRTATNALIYLGQTKPVSYTAWSTQGVAVATIRNAPGLPDTTPFWVFVNDGVVTEVAEYPSPISWSRSASAWPDLFPGCCDGGTVAPPSPIAPWPEQGWPVDGFYDAYPDEEAASHYVLTIRRYLSCRDHPAVCPEWWTNDEVFADPELPGLRRTLRFDEDLTVVIMPLFGESPAIVGGGIAFRDLRADLTDAIDEWNVDVDEALGWPTEWGDITADPSSPFGIAVWPGDEDGPLGYRGPGGSYLTLDYWWHVLEIRNGRPVLYVHAGLFAG